MTISLILKLQFNENKRFKAINNRFLTLKKYKFSSKLIHFVIISVYIPEKGRDNPNHNLTVKSTTTQALIFSITYLLT